MEVEKVGKKPRKSVKKLTTKTKWIILFSILGALIIGLIIAIVVVLVTRGGDVEEDPSQTEATYVATPEEIEDQALYDKISDDINAALTELYVEDADDIFAVYRGYIDDTKNEKVKAMIEIDYYNIMMVYDQGKERGEEILNALVKIDDAIKTINSAVAIVNAAEYYGNIELHDKYATIMVEREKEAGIDLQMETEG